MAEEGDDERRPSDDGAGSDAGKGGEEAEATMSHADEEEPMPDDDADVDPKKVRVARSSRERIGAVTTAALAGESCSGRQSLGSTINGSAHLAPSGALGMRIALFPSAAAESEDGEDQGPESGDAPAIVRHPPARSTTALCLHPNSGTFSRRCVCAFAERLCYLSETLGLQVLSADRAARRIIAGYGVACCMMWCVRHK